MSKTLIRRGSVVLAVVASWTVPVAALFFTSVARADSSLSNVQAAYVATYGAAAICPVLDEYHTIPGVIGVLKGVMSDGFTAGEAGTIIDAAVETYCPRNIPLIVQTAAALRAVNQSRGQIV